MTVPARLEAIISEFRTAPPSLRLPLLLEYARRLPPVPEGMSGQLERVQECQSPLFVKAELIEQTVRLYFDAAPEAPTTRGFASVVNEGLNGTSLEEVMQVSNDFYTDMGLSDLISPLRLRGMGSILARIKRQLDAYANI